MPDVLGNNFRVGDVNGPATGSLPFVGTASGVSGGSGIYRTSNGHLQFQGGSAGYLYVYQANTAVLLLPPTIQIRPSPLPAPSTDSPCWTDHPFTTETPIKAVHVNELRREIDQQRRAAGLSPFAWTDDPVIARYTLIKAAHFLELREALQAVWDRVGRGPLPAWSCGSPPSPERVVFATDVNDLCSWCDRSR